MGTSLTPLQTAERDIEELRQSIRRMFSDLLSLSLEAQVSDQQGHSIATRRSEMGAGEI